MLDANDARYQPQKKPFGRWLLDQASRNDATGDLAKAAKLDRMFPKDGDFEAVSRRLNEQQADGDLHATLEDAVIDWAAY